MTSINAEAMTLDAELGANIQAAMFRKRITQRQMAAHLGIGQSTISGKLYGRVSISVRDLYAIARLLDEEPGDLLPRLDSNQQPSGYLSLLVSASSQCTACGLDVSWYGTCTNPKCPRTHSNDDSAVSGCWVLAA